MTDLSPSAQRQQIPGHARDDGLARDTAWPYGRAQQHNAFSRERRVRFLDALALEGNVRVAAGEAGVSHMTAYRARRADPEFAGLWDAALVHARAWGEQELAARAFDGVEVPIVHGGQVMGFRTHHDPRWLLAHLARLDRAVEERGQAVLLAEHFDALLAQYAGHEAPEGFACAAAMAPEWSERGAALPPTRDDYVAWRCDREGCTGASRTVEARMAAAAEAAGEEWDRWRDGARAVVDGIVGIDEGEFLSVGVELGRGAPRDPSAPLAPGPSSSASGSASPPLEANGEGGDERPADPPLEYKSAFRRVPLGPVTPVTSVASRPARDRPRWGRDEGPAQRWPSRGGA